MQQGIQTAEDRSIMPRGMRPRICGWQCAKRVLCTRGSAEREQQPRNLSVGGEQQAVKENPLLGEQGLRRNAATNSGVPAGTPSATKPRSIQGLAADPDVAIGSERVNTLRVDTGAVPNAGLNRVEPEVGTIERMPLEALVQLERAVRWNQNVCIVEEGQGLLVRAEIRMQIAGGQAPTPRQTEPA